MKLRDVTIKLVSPLVLGAGPLLDLLNEVADCERAKLEAQVDKLRRNENRQYEAEYYDVPVSTLQQLDEMGIPWRRLVAMGPAGLTSVPADSGALLAANVTPTDEQVSLPAAAAEHHR